MNERIIPNGNESHMIIAHFTDFTELEPEAKNQAAAQPQPTQRRSVANLFDEFPITFLLLFVSRSRSSSPFSYNYNH